MNTGTRRDWLKLCGLYDMRKKYYICQRHFSAHFLHGDKLSPDAYPDLNLEHPDQQALNVVETIEMKEHKIDTKFSDAHKDLFNQSCERNCMNSVNNEIRSVEMQKEMDAMRNRIKLLEKLLDQNNDNEEEEYIWMLLNWI